MQDYLTVIFICLRLVKLSQIKTRLKTIDLSDIMNANLSAKVLKL